MFVFFNILGFKVSHKLPKNYYLLPRERIRAVAAKNDKKLRVRIELFPILQGLSSI